MTKKTKILIKTAVGLILVLIGLYFYPSRQTDTSPPILSSPASSVEEKAATPPTQPPPSSASSTELSFTATKAGTVYELMSSLQKEKNINFTEKNYAGIGKFIESINGIENNNKKSWIYYVNGKEAQVGVSNYKLEPEDVVSWKYENNY